MNLLPAYGILSSVYREGAYASILLGKGVDAFTEELVNRVLERNFLYQHTVSAMSGNPPRPKARLIVMMGFAMLDTMREPAYAVINTCVELAKELKLFETGYINAILKRFATGERPPLSAKNKTEADFNLPYGLFTLIKKDYPKAFAAILKPSDFREKHVRLKTGITEGILEGIPYRKTVYGYFVPSSPMIKQLFQEGKLTYQSLSSTYAVAAVGAKRGELILDLCAAPGGKSVAMAESGAKVTAAELYPHRAELIKSYAERMGVTLDLVVMDGTAAKKELIGRFDKVLVDAPCSGLGVIAKRKDMILKRTEKDIPILAATQRALLDTAAQYVISGGLLVYSTCTVLKAENADVTRVFLESHTDFKLEPLSEPFENTGEVQFLPDGKGMDGFYIARFRKC